MKNKLKYYIAMIATIFMIGELHASGEETRQILVATSDGPRITVSINVGRTTILDIKNQIANITGIQVSNQKIMKSFPLQWLSDDFIIEEDVYDALRNKQYLLKLINTTPALREEPASRRVELRNKIEQANENVERLRRDLTNAQRILDGLYEEVSNLG